VGGELPNNARSGLERFGASMAEMVSEKFVCRENAVAIHDLSGTDRQDFGDDPMPENANVLFEAAIPWSELRAEV